MQTIPVEKVEGIAFKMWNRDIDTRGRKRVIEVIFYDETGLQISCSHIPEKDFNDAPGKAISPYDIYKMPGFHFYTRTHEKMVKECCAWQPKKLREHQRLMLAQFERAQNNEAALGRLQFMERVLADAIELQEFE